LARSPKNTSTFNYQRELAVVLVIGFAVFYYIALFSFHPFDSSIFSASTPKVPIKNFAGSAGAFLAACAFYYFGILSFLLMLPLIYASFHLDSKKGSLLKIAKIFIGWSSFGLVLAVIATTFYSTVAVQNIEIPSAGLLGVESAKILFNIFGRFGVWIFLSTVLLVLLVLFRRVAVSDNVLKAQEESYSKIKSMSKSVGTSVRSSVANQIEKGKVSIAAFRAKNDPYQVVKEAQIQPSIANAVKVVKMTPTHSAPSADPIIPVAQAIPTEEKQNNSNNVALLRPDQQAQLEDLDRELYERPSAAFFVKSKDLELTREQESKLRETGDLLVKTFVEFGVKGSVIAIQPGPVVTVFEFRPDAGIKQSKIQGLVDDLALALRVPSVFIEPVQGKRALGIQVHAGMYESKQNATPTHSGSYRSWKVCGYQYIYLFCHPKVATRRSKNDSGRSKNA